MWTVPLRCIFSVFLSLFWYRQLKTDRKSWRRAQRGAQQRNWNWTRDVAIMLLTLSARGCPSLRFFPHVLARLEWHYRTLGTRFLRPPRCKIDVVAPMSISDGRGTHLREHSQTCVLFWKAFSPAFLWTFRNTPRTNLFETDCGFYFELQEVLKLTENELKVWFSPPAVTSVVTWSCSNSQSSETSWRSDPGGL